MEHDELCVSRLTVRGDDGRTAVVAPDGITLEGPNGWAVVAFDEDGTPRLTLASADGASTVRLRAGADGSGVSIKSGERQSSLVASGLAVSSGQRITLTDEGLTVKDADGQVLFGVPFNLAEAKNFVRELAGGFVSQAKGWLAEAFTPKTAE